MTGTVSNHRDALMERLVDRISAGLDELGSEIRAYLMQRATKAELRRLSPRELDDIGVSPFEIEDVAARASYDAR